jgi:nucleotide-binding universal stress UspA family protein
MLLVKSVLELRSVLVATDFSQASEKPLCHALAIARCYGAKFYLAHVVSSLGPIMASPDAIVASEEAAWRDAAHLEDDLVRNGALAGLQYQFLIGQGEVWPELETIIREQEIDLVVIGTHGRQGVRKLFLGSIAEQIFRRADCLVLTVGPGSYRESRVEGVRENRTSLFATDFGGASLHAFPFAVSAANQFAAKLALLHVIPLVSMPEGVNWCGASDVMRMRENARIASLRRLEELTRDVALQVKPEFHVEFQAVSPVSQTILEAAEKLRVDVIVMGLHRSTHIGTVSHMPWATAYEVVCRAGCPVLTVRK